MSSKSRRTLVELVRDLVLLEATRFKKETGKSLPRWKEKLMEYEKAGGYYVHFSSVPKMGIFTRNKYGTPIGFYCYPLKTYKVKDFATSRPYILVVKPKPEARLLDLESYSDVDLEEDIEKLGLENSALPRDAASKALVRTPGGVLWNITRVASQADHTDEYLDGIEKEKETKLPKRGGGPTGAWTMLFRQLGYDGVVDEGDRIIHHAEPYQAVFFDTTKLELVEVIEKPAEEEDDAGQLFASSYAGQDLRGADWSYKDLVGLNLRGANLQDANLYNADLRNSKLEGADLTGANVKSALFVGATYNSATKLPVGLSPSHKGMRKVDVR